MEVTDGAADAPMLNMKEAEEIAPDNAYL